MCCLRSTSKICFRRRYLHVQIGQQVGCLNFQMQMWLVNKSSRLVSMYQFIQKKDSFTLIHWNRASKGTWGEKCDERETAFALYCKSIAFLWETLYSLAKPLCSHKRLSIEEQKSVWKEMRVSKWQLHFHFWLFLSVKCDLNLETIKSHALRSEENLKWFAVFGGCPTGLVSPVILSLGERGKPFSTPQRRPGTKAGLHYLGSPSHILTLTSWGHHISRKCLSSQARTVKAFIWQLKHCIKGCLPQETDSTVRGKRLQCSFYTLKRHS